MMKCRRAHSAGRQVKQQPMVNTDDAAARTERNQNGDQNEARRHHAQALSAMAREARTARNAGMPLPSVDCVGERSSSRWPLIATLSAGAMIAILLVAGCASTPRTGNTASTQTTTTPTAYPTPTASSPTALTRAPRDCPTSQAAQTVLPGISPVMGGAPVWASLSAIVHIPSYSTYTRFGWPWEIVWEVGPSYTSSVALRGGSLRNSTPLWFQFAGDPTIAPVLDPNHPDHPVSNVGDGWAEWGSYVFLPATGCYYIEATWPGGSWRLDFAAGS